jgi:ATP-dependent protease ClpP protease subunit
MNVNWDKYREDALRGVREKGIIPIVNDIKPELAAIVTECVFEALLRNIKCLTVLIDTNGGDIRAGNGIANTLSLASANGIDVTGLVLARASSMGFQILQACKQRVACRGAYLMMHWGQITLQNDDFAAVMRGEEAWVLEQIKDSRLEMLKVFVKRSGLEEEKIRQMCDREVSLYPDKALELHLIDSIADASEFKIQQPKENGIS